MLHTLSVGDRVVVEVACFPAVLAPYQGLEQERIQLVFLDLVLLISDVEVLADVLLASWYHLQSNPICVEVLGLEY